MEVGNWKEAIGQYLDQFIRYVATNPKDFLVTCKLYYE